MIIAILAFCLCTAVISCTITQVITKQKVLNKVWEKIAFEDARDHTAESFRSKALNIITLSHID